MEPRIVFLGTGGDSVVVGKQLRASGGMILQDGQLQLHIDPGPGSLAQLKATHINVRETSCILVSHPHTNHANDVRALIEAMTLGGLDKRGVLVCSESCLQPPEKTLPIASEFHLSCLEKVAVLKPGQVLGVGDIEIQAAPTLHSVAGIGFLISTENFTMGYTSDTSFSEQHGRIFEGVDFLVLNVIAPFGFSADHHLNSESAVAIIKRASPKVAIITHFGIKMLEQNTIYQAREIHRRTGVSVLAAEDGMVVSPRSYSIRRSQKRLSSF